MHYQKYNLLIDSSRRSNIGEPNTDFNVYLKNSYRVKNSKLKMASIPFTSYNIDATNDTFSYTSTVGGFTVTLPHGYYSAQLIAERITLQIAAAPAGGTVIMIYDVATGLFRLYTSDVSLLLVSSGPLLNPLLLFLGFPSSGWFNTAPFIATSFCSNFFSTDYFKLNINYLNTNQISVDNINTNSTFIIEKNLTIYQSFGDSVFIQNLVDDTGCKNNNYDEPIHLQNFRVSLTDKNNNLIDLNGIDWYCIIELVVIVDISTPIICY